MTTKQRLRIKADKLYIEKVMKLRGDTCELCGRPAKTVHHFIPKSRSEAVRYDPDNGVVICQGCHKKIHSWDPYLSGKVVAQRGSKWYNDLDKRSRDLKSGRVTVKYLKDIINILESV